MVENNETSHCPYHLQPCSEHDQESLMDLCFKM
ncbi:rCG55167 [Rattus norvegicus]|uniref:RCG55167 n=1 Tax=Rattus norvegicus TaxID=10116 RepID=A6J809_RAT|nr:rCG55167 [Rattus norvegicus]